MAKHVSTLFEFISQEKKNPFLLTYLLIQLSSFWILWRYFTFWVIVFCYYINHCSSISSWVQKACPINLPSLFLFFLSPLQFLDWKMIPLLWAVLWVCSSGGSLVLHVFNISLRIVPGIIWFPQNVNYVVNFLLTSSILFFISLK